MLSGSLRVQIGTSCVQRPSWTENVAPSDEIPFCGRTCAGSSKDVRSKRLELLSSLLLNMPCRKNGSCIRSKSSSLLELPPLELSPCKAHHFVSVTELVYLRLRRISCISLIDNVQQTSLNNQLPFFSTLLPIMV